MTAALVLARIGLAAVFAVAGVAKLADREGSARAAREFGLGRLASAAAVLVPLVELGIAAALVPVSSARVAAAGAALLLLAFAVAIVVALARGQRPDCHCFGKLHSSQAGPATLLRNTGLAAVAAAVAAGPAGQVGWLELAGSAAAVLVIAQVIVGYVLLRRYGRALRRIDELEGRLEHETGSDIGSPAPDFTLPASTGTETKLTDLLAPARPVLLVFVDTGCGACTTLLPELGRWQHERREDVTLAVIGQGDPERLRAAAEEHGIERLLLARDKAVTDAYGAYGIPSAVLIAPDGLVASPLLYGAQDIELLFGGPEKRDAGEAVVYA